jgi:hypothetical protein
MCQHGVKLRGVFSDTLQKPEADFYLCLSFQCLVGVEAALVSDLLLLKLVSSLPGAAVDKTRTDMFKDEQVSMMVHHGFGALNTALH